MNRLAWLAALAVVLVLPATADDDDLSGARLINAEVRKALEENEIQWAGRSTDAEFLRRVSLDLIGTVPNLEQTKAFLADKARNKREKLIDKLMAHPRFSENWAAIWTGILTGFSGGRFRYGDRGALTKGLRELLEDDTPYNEFVRKLVTGKGKYDTNPENAEDNNPLVLWYAPWSRGRERAFNIGGKMSKTFLGIQIQCAQCHDHPFDKWTQDDFRGMAAFFDQLTLRGTDYYLDADGNKLTKRDLKDLDLKKGELRKKYKKHSVFTLNDPDPKRFKNNKKRKPNKNKKRKAPEKLPDPAFILNGEGVEQGIVRREAFAEHLTSTENRQFARAYINRMWFYFFGRGIVAPFDSFTARNRPSIPTLMEGLVDDFVAHDFDMKYLIKSIVSSDVYQRTSSMSKLDSFNEKYFPYAKVRALTPEQLLNAIADSTGLSNTKQGKGALKYAKQFRYNFGDDEGNESADFAGTVTQSLFLMNGAFSQSITSAFRGGTLEKILQDSKDPKERIVNLFLAFLQRRPNQDELTQYLEHVNSAPKPEEPKKGKRKKRQKGVSPAAAQPYEDIVWVILNSGEFLFNK